MESKVSTARYLLVYRMDLVSVNNEFCHGVPSHKKELQEESLTKIDVSTELNSFWKDNDGSFVLGNAINQHQGRGKAFEKKIDESDQNRKRQH